MELIAKKEAALPPDGGAIRGGQQEKFNPPNNKFNIQTKQERVNQKVDFKAVKLECLKRCPGLLQSWLPDGKLQGDEYVARNPTRADNQRGSFKINIKTGVWADFATDDNGADLISLYAYLKSLSQIEATTQLAQKFGLQGPTQVTLISSNAPEPNFNHPLLGESIKVWSYKDQKGRILGHVIRFEPAGQRKQILPQTLWQDTNGHLFWQWKAFEKPRPLYGLWKLPGNQKPVLVVEGEKASDAGQELLKDAYAVLTWPGGTNAVRYADFYPLRGRVVCVWPDNDDPGRKAAREVAKSCLKVGAKTVYLIEPPQDKAKGWDLADALNEDWTQDEVLQWIKHHKKKYDGLNKSDDKQQEPKKTQAQILGEILENSSVMLFRDQKDDAYARIDKGDHFEIYPVRSKAFKRWITHQYYSQFQKPPGAQAVADAVGLAEAKAQFEGQNLPVFLRIAHKDNIYVDLGDDKWRVVEITTAGWSVLNKSPVVFRRPNGMKSLPTPKKSKDGLCNILKLFGFKHKNDKILCIAWLLGCLAPDGPYPLLLLQGPQGTGKSTKTKFLKMLLDPFVAPVRTIPRNEDDLLIAAQNNHVLSFDNLSGLPAWLSDALSRLATGGALSKRELYTNGEEFFFEAMRPVILNGIDAIATRNDLADRALILNLEPITENERRPLAEIEAEFHAVLPEALGCLFDAVACGLKNWDTVKLDRLPRMADFAKWIVACEPKLVELLDFWLPDDFIQAYDAKRKDLVADSLQADEVAKAVISFIDEADKFSGTASELLEELNSRVPERVQRLKIWPKTGNSLSRKLGRLAVFLQEAGYLFEKSREAQTRYILLERVCKKQSSSSLSSLSNNFNKLSSDDIDDGNDNKKNIVTIPSCHNLLKSQNNDTNDGNDEKFHTQSKKWGGPDVIRFTIN